MDEFPGVVLLRTTATALPGPADLSELSRSLATGTAEATVVVATDGPTPPALWTRLNEVLDKLAKKRVKMLRLLAPKAGAGTGNAPPLAQRIADAWRLDVIAPDETVLFVPGGSLFAPSGGWLLFRPDIEPTPLGARQPAPGWQGALSGLPDRTATGWTVEQVPAGLLVRPPGTPAPGPGDLCYAVPVDLARPVLLVGVPGAGGDLVPPPDDLTALLAGLPAETRSLVRLAPGTDLDLLPAAQRIADAFGAETEVLTGVPLGRTEEGPVLVDGHGNPTWRPYAAVVACRPGGAGDGKGGSEPRLLSGRSPLPGFPLGQDGVIPLGERWQAAVTRSGLALMPTGHPAPLAQRPVTAGQLAIEIVASDEPLGEAGTRALARLLTGLGPELRDQVGLYAPQRDQEDTRRLRRLAVDHEVRLIWSATTGADPASQRLPGAEPRPAAPAEVWSADPAPLVLEHGEASAAEDELGSASGTVPGRSQGDEWESGPVPPPPSAIPDDQPGSVPAVGAPDVTTALTPEDQGPRRVSPDQVIPPFAQQTAQSSAAGPPAPVQPSPATTPVVPGGEHVGLPPAFGSVPAGPGSEVEEQTRRHLSGQEILQVLRALEAPGRRAGAGTSSGLLRPWAGRRPAALAGADGAADAEWAPRLVAVHGDYDLATGVAVIDGAELDAFGAADWILDHTDWRPGRGLGLLLSGAAAPGPQGGPSFAAQIATRLGAPLLAPRGPVDEAEGWKVVGPARDRTPVTATAEAGTPQPSSLPRIVVSPPAEPEHQAPWYLERRALGEATVAEVHHGADDAALGHAADEVAAATRRSGDGEDLGTAIRGGVRQLLETRSAHTWDRLLRRGRMLVADGRLVWLRPVAADVVPAEQPEAGEIQVYGVSFTSATASGERERAISHGVDAMLLSLLSLGSAVASTFMLGLPRLAAGVENSRAEAWKRTITAGRKLFVKKRTSFDAGIQVLVFVDGKERGHGVVTPGLLGLDLPKDLSAAGGPRPDTGVPLSNPGGTGFRQPSGAREVLNAVDLVPVVAALQRRLLGAGLPPEAALAALDEALVVLDEKGLRNRSRMLGSNGVVSRKVRVQAGRNAAGLPKWFEGHFVITSAVDRLQYLGDVKARIRDDAGGGHATGRTRKAVSKSSAGFGFDVLGLHHPGSSRSRTGVAPIFGFTQSHQRVISHHIIEQSAGRTVLNLKGPLSRYLAGLLITVEIRSGTHTLDPVRETVDGEVGVPRQEAPHFERRLLGRVRTPALRPAGPPQEGPVTAQPHVRALLREAALPLDASAYRRPARLDDPLARPHPREPLALAARRGMGFSAQFSLPGSELVHDQLRAKLVEMDASPSKDRETDWSQADLDLSVWYSRPALEGDLAQLMYGIKHTVRVGGRDYLLFARAHLRERLTNDPVTYPMTVNARAQQMTQVTGHRGTAWKAKAGLGGGARLEVEEWMNFQLGGIGGEAEYGQGGGYEYSGTVKSYRRTETDGDVDEHVYDVVYELGVRPAGGSTARWWIDRLKLPEAWWDTARSGATAHVAVSHEHVPKEPPTEDTVRRAGHPEELLGWPDDERIDFEAAGTSGVFPAFFAIPELPELAAAMYAKVNGLPASWSADRFNWPAGLDDMFSPLELAAHFGAETSRLGRPVELPDGADGWKQALRLRVRAYRPRHLNPGDGIELEQYTQGGAGQKRGREHAWGIGAEGAFGPQIHFGHGSIGKAGSQPGSAQEAEHEQEAGPFLSGGLHVHGGVGKEWKRQKSLERSQVDITRATYEGSAHSFRADPVFEISLVRWKGRRLTRTTRVLRVRDAIDLLAPERLVADLGLSGLLPEETDAAQAQAASTTESEKAERPQRHVHPGLLPGTGYPERLRLDDVLDLIKAVLRHRGVLPTEAVVGEARLNQLVRELESSFSSEALRNQWPLLVGGAGVIRWLPLPRAFGAAKYLWIKVTARTLAATSDRPRPDVKLTLRSQAQDEVARKRARGNRYAGGVEGHLLGGRGRGEGGLQGGGGYQGGSEHAAEHADKHLEIHRANPVDASHEFEHPVVSTVEMGVTTELPDLLHVLLSGAKAGLLRGARALRLARQAAEWWYSHRPFLWTYEERTSGDVRLLVPEHVVEDGPAPDLEPVLGSEAAWHPAPLPPPTREVHLSADNPHQLLAAALHPWALPAAAAVRRWAAVAAAPFRPPSDLSADRAWHVPGLDFTSVHGMRYEHFTGAGMLLSNIGELLGHTYQVPVGRDRRLRRPGSGALPVGDRTVLVGMNILRAEGVGPRDGALFKARHYTQDDDEAKEEAKKHGGWLWQVGPQGAGDDGQGQAFLALIPVKEEHDRSVELSGRLDETEEDNRVGTRRYRHYRFDVELQFQGPRGIVRVQAPGGLYGMLPLEPQPDASGWYRVAQSLEELLPDVFGRAAEPPPGHPREPEAPPRYQPNTEALPEPGPAAPAVAAEPRCQADGRVSLSAGAPEKPPPPAAAAQVDSPQVEPAQVVRRPAARPVVHVDVPLAPEGPSESDSRSDVSERSEWDEDSASETSGTEPSDEPGTPVLQADHAALAWDEIMLARRGANPGPLDRKGLLEAMRRVVKGTGPRTSADCVPLLEALRKELFPRGVRPAGPVDDASLADGSAAARLAPGPGWRRVSAWETVQAAVDVSGPGATALVLALRQGKALGHAWAAYHLAGPEGGAVWVDLQAPVGRWLEVSPQFAPGDAQVVVLDAAGAVLPRALPDFRESSSSQHAMLDRAVERRQGAIGPEVEELTLPGDELPKFPAGGSTVPRGTVPVTRAGLAPAPLDASGDLGRRRSTTPVRKGVEAEVEVPIEAVLGEDELAGLQAMLRVSDVAADRPWTERLGTRLVKMIETKLAEAGAIDGHAVVHVSVENEEFDLGGMELATFAATALTHQIVLHVGSRGGGYRVCRPDPNPSAVAGG